MLHDACARGRHPLREPLGRRAALRLARAEPPRRARTCRRLGELLQTDIDASELEEASESYAQQVSVRSPPTRRPPRTSPSRQRTEELEEVEENLPSGDAIAGALRATYASARRTTARPKGPPRSSQAAGLGSPHPFRPRLWLLLLGLSLLLLLLRLGRLLLRRRRRRLREGWVFGCGRFSATRAQPRRSRRSVSRAASSSFVARGVYASAEAESAAPTGFGSSSAVLTSFAAFSSWRGACASSRAHRAGASPRGTSRRLWPSTLARRARAATSIAPGFARARRRSLRRSRAGSVRIPPWRRSLSHVGAEVTSVTRSSKSARSTRIETRSASAIILSRRFGFSQQVARTARALLSSRGWPSASRRTACASSKRTKARRSRLRTAARRRGTSGRRVATRAGSR